MRMQAQIKGELQHLALNQRCREGHRCGVEARLDLCFRGPEVPLFHPEREQRGFGATRQTRELTIEMDGAFMADAPSSLVLGWKSGALAPRKEEQKEFSARRRPPRSEAKRLRIRGQRFESTLWA